MARAADGQLTIARDALHLAQAAAEWLADRIAQSRGPFRLVLSGGTTPGPLYALLASKPWRGRIDWARLEIFWADERAVPRDHPDSNARMVRGLLLDHLPLEADQIHPIPTDGTLESCAAHYEALLKRRYGRAQLSAHPPLFDAVMLGIGRDGHTASLLPGQPVLDETRRWVAGVPHGAPQPRLTLTYPAIASSRHIAFLATGPQKADPVAAAFAGDMRLPAARVTGAGDILWFLDGPAAAKLETQTLERHARTD